MAAYLSFILEGSSTCTAVSSYFYRRRPLPSLFSRRDLIDYVLGFRRKRHGWGGTEYQLREPIAAR